MAEISIEFDYDGFSMQVKFGNDEAKVSELLDNLPAIVKSIRTSGALPKGSIADTESCKAAYLLGTTGSTPETRKKTYWRVYGSPGTWIAKFGCPIWPEVMTELGYEPEKMQVGKEYNLSGCTVTFSVKQDKETGKINPEKVISIQRGTA